MTPRQLELVRPRRTVRSSEEAVEAVDPREGSGERPDPPAPRSEDLRPPGLPLDRTQAWMQAVLLHTGELEDALAAPGAAWIVPPERVGDVVRPSRTLAPEERVAIYRDMVLARFAQTLEHQFPALRRRLAERFPDLVRAYVAAHASRSCTLAELGARLPDFLDRSEGLAPRARGALADLARLEWALQQAFDLPGAEPLGPEALARVPAEAWARARLVPVPSLRLLELAHDAADALDDPWDGPIAPRRTFLAVWRRKGDVRRLQLRRSGAALLRSLLEGTPLAEALDESGATPRAVQGWLSRWTAAGFFAAVETGDPSAASE